MNIFNFNSDYCIYEKNSTIYLVGFIRHENNVYSLLLYIYIDIGMNKRFFNYWEFFDFTFNKDINVQHNFLKQLLKPE